MQELLFASVLGALVVGGIFVAIVRRLAFAPAACPSAEWLDHFSVARYRPMERLLDETDFAFLSSQRGGGAALARQLRVQRRKLFRHYLKLLRRDFQRIYMALELQLVHSPKDRPELAAMLLKQRAAFTLGMLRVEGCLTLHACGFGRVEVRGILDALESLRLELHPLAVNGAAA